MAGAPGSARVGEPVTLAVSLRPEGQGAPSGEVTVRAGEAEGCALAAPEGRCTLTFATAGSRTIAASYAGDGNFESAASTPVALTVEPAVTSISLEVAADQAMSGRAQVVRATVSLQPPSVGTPFGAVQFSEGDLPLGQPVPLSDGAASLSLSDLPAGPHTIRVVYLGDDSHLASEAVVSVKVTAAKGSHGRQGEDAQGFGSLCGAAGRRDDRSPLLAASRRARRPRHFGSALGEGVGSAVEASSGSARSRRVSSTSGSRRAFAADREELPQRLGRRPVLEADARPTEVVEHRGEEPVGGNLVEEHRRRLAPAVERALRAPSAPRERPRDRGRRGRAPRAPARCRRAREPA